MVTGAQFIFANFNTAGTMRILQSSNVDKLLQTESVRYLIDLSRYLAPSPEPYINKFETEQCVAYTFLQQVTDEHGRKTVANKTYIFRMDDLFLEFQKRLPQEFYTIPKEPSQPLPTINV